METEDGCARCAALSEALEESRAANREICAELQDVRRELEAAKTEARARGADLRDLRAVAQRGLGMLHGGE